MTTRVEIKNLETSHSTVVVLKRSKVLFGVVDEPVSDLKAGEVLETFVWGNNEIVIREKTETPYDELGF